MRQGKYKILIIAPSWVGDLVMSQTLFKLLKQHYGDELELHVFANDWTEGILFRMPEVKLIIKNPFQHNKIELLERIKLGLSLRKQKYGEVFVLPNSLKAALVPFFAGIPKRTGFIGEFRYGLLNNIYKLDKIKLPLMVDRFCALAHNGLKPHKIDYPQLELNIQNKNELIEKLSLNTSKKIIGFCPAAEYGPAKRWEPNYFAKLADMLIADGFIIVILGSKKDFALGESILQQMQHIYNIKNLCGKTSLADSVDVISLCDTIVTNDSGLMHVACAVGVKVIAIYGSSSTSFTPPLSDKAQIVNVALDCSPCFQRTCRYGHYNCLKFITPDVIYHRITKP
ncbi:MAG: lipopolysaccharide heptosyltransferase II [Burkholderiales bacterium]|nr:lipopolysaccharide heptosyltransferase II [Burkholderiales bacterium]